MLAQATPCVRMPLLPISSGLPRSFNIQIQSNLQKSCYWKLSSSHRSSKELQISELGVDKLEFYECVLKGGWQEKLSMEEATGGPRLGCLSSAGSQEKGALGTSSGD